VKPGFIVIGAMKCGTSTVCSYLERHPEVFMLPDCELDFFSRDANFAKGVSWYEAHFDGHADKAVVGEGSNSYAAAAIYPDTAVRMAAYNPDIKIIYIVRNPLERLISAWVQTRADSGDKIPATVDGAVTERPEFFVDQSLYWDNISRYRTLFPDHQIHVSFMEDLKADPDMFFKALADFLGISPMLQISPGQVNPSQGKRILSARYTRLRRLPAMNAMSRLPRPVKRFIKRELFSQTLHDTPRLSAQVHDDLVARLRPDAMSFLEAYGKPADFWSFSR
jgi:hypothetical protein